jgi:choline dehydrogenase-like flavoprotein
VRAEREVLLSAGAYESPKLLMLSGIGRGRPAAFGIEVVRDLED